VKELDTQVLLSKEFGYIKDASDIEKHIVIVLKILFGLKRATSN
jgi:hypothetical protein|tara:strand:- start:39 stop:170 length:132 start_codon:yes stop_codon:yes gene_type:complete